MTAFEAFDKIERALTRLEVKDRFGEPYIGIELIGQVSAFSRGAWEILEDLLQKNEITPDEYCSRALALIDSYGRHVHGLRVARMFENIREPEKHSKQIGAYS